MGFWALLPPPLPLLPPPPLGVFTEAATDGGLDAEAREEDEEEGCSPCAAGPPFLLPLPAPRCACPPLAPPPLPALLTLWA